MIIIASSNPVTIHRLLFTLQSGPLSLLTYVVLTIAVLAYIASIRKVRHKGRIWPIKRTLSFLSGIFVVWVAVLSGFASYDDERFDMHVIQHLLLMNLAAIMFALSAPITIFFQALPIKIRTKLIRLIHSRIFGIIHHPMLATILGVAFMYAYFLTPFYNLSLQHVLLHDSVHLTIFILGCMYWWPIVGLDPIKWRLSFGERMLYLLIPVVLDNFLGISLMAERTSLSPLNSLASIHQGGAIFWLGNEAFNFFALIIVAILWITASEEQARRKEEIEDLNEVKALNT